MSDEPVKFLTKIQHDAELVKLKKIGELLSKFDFKVEEFAKEFGLKKRYRNQGSKGPSTSPFIFISKKRKCVVKVPFTIGRKIPNNSIPTIVIKRPLKTLSGDYDHDPRFGYIFIQPLGEVKNQKKAHSLLYAIHASRHADDHEGNAAWFKGCPVWIDW